MTASITCRNPLCGKVLSIAKLPSSRVKIICPLCQQTMVFDPSATLSHAAPPLPAVPPSPGGENLETRSMAGAGTGRDSHESPPAKIGRFEIRRFLGEGAFGAVYEGHDPQLDRAVAIKVAKLGRGDASHRVKRFLREAKAAAGLRHPNIVPVHEFGQEGDQFSIVSAYIRGQTLQQRLKTESVDLPRAARIVRQLAEALAYAHDQGIVHRDVKPANILCDERGEPMLTDFGLATRQDDVEQLTHQGQVLGTPRYMAPEQARGQEGPAQPAADQYALGVILYEMIAGKPLFEGTAELVMYHHQETEAVSPRQHNRGVSRDLETICLKMLEKDPARRYAGCMAVAEDLRRMADGEPIHARRIGTVERVSRWTRRNPLSALLMAAVACSLMIGTGVSLAFAYQAEQQADIAKTNAKKANEKELEAIASEQIAKKNEELAKIQAELARKNAVLANEQTAIAKANAERATRESEKAKKVSLFLGGLFDASDPIGLTGYAFGPDVKQSSKVTAQDILLRGAAKIRTELKDQPETRAAVLIAIGGVFRMMGQYKEAQPLLEEALELRKSFADERPGELAEAWFQLGWLHHMRGDTPSANRCYKEVLRLAQGPPADAELISRCEFNMAWLLTERKQLRPAEALFRKVLSERKQRLGDNHFETAVAQAGLASVLLHTTSNESGFGDIARTAEALKLISPALATFRKSHGDESIAKSLGLGQEAILAAAFAQFGVADEKMRKVVEINRQKLGDTHPFLAWALGLHGYLLEASGKVKEAAERYAECLDVCRGGMGLDHVMVIRVVDRLAGLKATQGDIAGARRLYDEMYAAVVEHKGENHLLASDVAFMYGYFLHRRNLPDEAAPWFTKVIQAKLPPDEGLREACKANYYLGMGHGRKNPSRAADHYREALRIFDSVPGDQSLLSFSSREILLVRLIISLEGAGRLGELIDAIAEIEKSPPSGKQAVQAMTIVTSIRQQLPARLADETARVAMHFAHLRSGSPLECLAANGFAATNKIDSLFESGPAFQLQSVVDVAKSITSDSAVDPASKRPVEVVTATFKKGMRYQFDLMSKNVDPLLSLRNSAGRELAKNDDRAKGTLDSRIVWTCPADGEYQLVCGTFGAKRFGDVRLTAQSVVETVAIRLAPTVFHYVGILPRGNSPRNAQNFTVSLEAGNNYVIDLKSTEFDALLKLSDDSGKLLISDDDGGDNLDARIRFRPTRSGDYVITVATFEANQHGEFLLTVRFGRPD